MARPGEGGLGWVGFAVEALEKVPTKCVGSLGLFAETNVSWFQTESAKYDLSEHEPVALRQTVDSFKCQRRFSGRFK